MTSSQSPGPVDVGPVREQVASLLPRALDDLRTLVGIASVADERLYPKENCERAGQWVVDAFRAEGIDDARLVETPDGSKVVLGYRPGPPGSPTVLLYSHYDVQPPLDDAAWRTPPFELTERDGRLYGRGAADSKGNIVAHLTALRTLRALTGDDFPVGVRIVIEGSEEQGTGGLDQYVEAHPGELGADAMLIADTGNATLGLPTLTVSLRGAANVVVTVEALRGEIHSGMFGGAAPDALAALVHILSSLRDEEGNTTIDGVPAAITDATWPGVDYDPVQFRNDAGMLDGTRLLGSGRVSDQLWARPAVTILGIDAPNVVGSAAAIQPRAAARLNLRIPPGADARDLQDKLVAHLEAHAPWGVKVTTVRDAVGQPFSARTDGHVFDTLSRALADAFGQETVTAGQGGSIPLCNVLASTYPDAQIVLLGVEEPACLIHAPNESVAPSEIEQLSVGEALFLSRLGAS